MGPEIARETCIEAIERGEQTVVGVNRFVESEPSPLAGAADTIVTVSPQAEAEQIERLQAWRAEIGEGRLGIHRRWAPSRRRRRCSGRDSPAPRSRSFQRQ